MNHSLIPAHFLFHGYVLDCVVLYVFDVRATRDLVDSLVQEDHLELASLDQRLWPDNSNLRDVSFVWDKSDLLDGRLLCLVLYLQGDQGFAGEPGIPGQKGAGEPGPKVRELSSLFRTAAPTENQEASCLCLSRASQE